MPYINQLNEIRKYRKLTHQMISENSKPFVPLGTVSRILSGDTDNPSFESVVGIVTGMNYSVDQLVGIPVTNRTDCGNLPSSHEIELYQKQINDAPALYQKQAEAVIAVYKKQLEDTNAIHEKRIRDKNLWIKILFGLVALLIVGYIALIAFDFSHHDDFQQEAENPSYYYRENP